MMAKRTKRTQHLATLAVVTMLPFFSLTACDGDVEDAVEDVADEVEDVVDEVGK